MRSQAGAWVGVGAGVGVAMGTALHSVALGLAIGVAVGAALAFGLDRAPTRDHAPALREAIAEARAAGFGPAADALESACFGTAFTTSSSCSRSTVLRTEIKRNR